MNTNSDSSIYGFKSTNKDTHKFTIYNNKINLKQIGTYNYIFHIHKLGISFCMILSLFWI